MSNKGTIRSVTINRPRPALMWMKTWDRGTHSHHTTVSHHSHSNRLGWRRRRFLSLWLTATTWVCHYGVYWLWLWVCHRGSGFCLLWVWVLLTVVGIIGCCIWCWLCWWWIGAIVFPLPFFFFFFFFLLVLIVDYGLLVVVVLGVCSTTMVGLWWRWFQ